MGNGLFSPLNQKIKGKFAQKEGKDMFAIIVNN